MLKLVVAAVLFTSMAVAQTSPEPLDGPRRLFRDDLLENLLGHWNLGGTILGRASPMDLDVTWVLNHQFLHIREKAKTAAPGQVPYEVEIFIGYDNTSERYVLHWIDVYGGRFSETLGYGTRKDNVINFVFEYGDGPFHNKFIWNPESKTWHFVLEQKNAGGQWKNFADQTATKS